MKSTPLILSAAALLMSISAMAQSNEPVDATIRELVTTYNNSHNGMLYIGVANHAKDIGTLSTRIADREFGYITPSNDFKQSYIHPEPGRWRWELPDAYVNHAAKNNQILRIHCPLSPQCSQWARDDARSLSELDYMLDEYMTAVCLRYGNSPTVRWMDVVNEIFTKAKISDPKYGVYNQADWFGPREGSTKWENPWLALGYDTINGFEVPKYIIRAFEISNRCAPGVLQIINQHGDFEKPIWEKMKSLVMALRERGIRVDGLGWQAHIDTGWEKGPGRLEYLDDFIGWCHDNSLEFHITEMNVWIKDDTKADENQQAATFLAVVNTLLRHADRGAIGINFWNVRDDDTNNPAWRGSLWRNDGTPRPALGQIKQALVDAINNQS